MDQPMAIPSTKDSAMLRQLDLPSSPPPYEAPAYPRLRPHRRPLLRKLFSLQVLLALSLTFAVSWLCLQLERETKLRRVVHHAASPAREDRFRASLRHCATLRTFPARPRPETRTENPRWNAVRGQNETVTLVNVTLFDGESIVQKPMDISFEKGLIISVEETTEKSFSSKYGGQVYNLHGRWVTPGLVDMHSHHSIEGWPEAVGKNDGNEVSPLFGPLTPFLRALDSMKASDIATKIIMSGGVTSSLVIPGSANIMGGEGAVVKNALRSGPHGEYVMEELLLEHGVPMEERHRYMKMACGENPSGTYGHTRMGNAWILRKHLAQAKELMGKQDEYCAAAARVAGAGAGFAEQSRFVEQMGGFPTELELESTIGMLRGRVAMQNHCYLPEDFETMLRISHEFGFRVRAFHHAIEAWQVPEMLKEYGENITIATFSDFSLYKWEAYFPSLYAGAILDTHGVPVAYKSDHFESETNAKYLMAQAAMGFWFFLVREKALQSVTSIPAKAIDLDYRIGYARPGYDADLVVWDTHPLRIGATPLQVFIDGVSQLNTAEVEKSMGANFAEPVNEAAVAVAAVVEEPKMRAKIEESERQAVCSMARAAGSSFIITGIKKSFMDNWPKSITESAEGGHGNLTLVVSDGSISCFAPSCESAIADLQSTESPPVRLSLSNGHLTPGLTALTSSLGMIEISTDPSTGDGIVDPLLDARDPSNLPLAKFGVELRGKAFARARMGGVTRAVSPPTALAGGFAVGVSVGILTGEGRDLLDGGVFREEVALHLRIDGRAKVGPYGSISKAVKLLREIVASGKGKYNETLYGRVAAGNLPLIVVANNQYDIQQLIMFKKDFPDVKVVLQGGAEAPYVADELAEAKIPVILTQGRPAPEEFRNRDAVVGPPLTPSVARYLTEAGVLYAIAIVHEMPPGDSGIHTLALEASWAAKFAQLSEHETVRLVTSNVETILGLKKSRDFVAWEDTPLQYGGTVALSFHETIDGKLQLSACWPDEDDEDGGSGPTWREFASGIGERDG